MRLAYAGFVVVGLDYFFNDPVYIHDGEQGFDRPAWMAKSKAQAREYEPKWFEAIKERFGVLNPESPVLLSTDMLFHTKGKTRNTSL